MNRWRELSGDYGPKAFSQLLPDNHFAWIKWIKTFAEEILVRGVLPNIPQFQR